MEKGRRDTVLLTVIAIATLLVAIVGATFAFFTARLTGENTTSTIYVKSSNGGTITFTGGNLITMNNIYPRAEAWVKKPFKVEYSNANGNYAAKYRLYLKYTNSIGYNDTEAAGQKKGEIKYELTSTSGYCADATKTTKKDCGAENWTDATNPTGTVLVANETGYFRTVGNNLETEPLGNDQVNGDIAVFPGSTNATQAGVATNQAHTYMLTISYPDTGVNQNYANRTDDGTNQDKGLTVYVHIEEVKNSEA